MSEKFWDVGKFPVGPTRVRLPDGTVTMQHIPRGSKAKMLQLDGRYAWLRLGDGGGDRTVDNPYAQYRLRHARNRGVLRVAECPLSSDVSIAHIDRSVQLMEIEHADGSLRKGACQGGSFDRNWGCEHLKAEAKVRAAKHLERERIAEIRTKSEIEKAAEEQKKQAAQNADAMNKVIEQNAELLQLLAGQVGKKKRVKKDETE